MANYRRVFLDGYSYYLTIVTYRRNPILLENLSLLRRAFAYSKERFDYRIEAIVILPDHFHMIITPRDAGEYPAIVSTIKRYFSQHCDPKYYAHMAQSASRYKRRLKPIWQKRFFEHTIRSEKDFFEKIRYMYHNPVKHGYVDDPAHWAYSSFSKDR
jgi:putative transposase